jgi:hypothetical protein
MKKLVLVLLFVMALPIRAMDPIEKAVARIAGAVFMGYLVHEYLIKDPQVRQREQQERKELTAKKNVVWGSVGLEKTRASK